MNPLKSLVVLAAATGIASGIPALQLGPGETGDWSYSAGTQTWVTDSSMFTLEATANADGGSGDYAWEAAGSGTQYAYLVFAGVPGVNADAFDITVMNDGVALSLYTSGYGTPPIEDPNSLAPHGIYATYFEIYRFSFNGPVTTISNTQPGQEADTGAGYTESFAVTVNSLFPDMEGIHMDLFTVQGDGVLNLGSSDRDTVEAFAPFSHDAEYHVPDGGATITLLGVALLGVVGLRRKFRR